jgi:phosphate transport system ATP-binding protein
MSEKMNDTITEPERSVKLKTNALNLYYGAFHALGDITMDIYDRKITAIIGPSGCGKSSLLRVFNRMNDLIPGVKVEGEVLLDNLSIYGKSTDVVSIREKIGMVFQKPNVFPMNIYDNIAIGPRRHGVKGAQALQEIVERSLKQVALWEEVKDNLKKQAPELSPGQQQLLCIARAVAVEPDVILMDEPCSRLDPESTMKIEELMLDLVKEYTIIIVTHNMEQALRVSDMAAFLMIGQDKVGKLVEYENTLDMFSTPKDQRTEDYITGRFG